MREAPVLRDALWFVAGLIGGALTTELVGWFKSSGDRRFAAFRSAWSNPRRFGMAMAVLGELYGSSHDMLRLGATAYPCVAWATRGDDVEAILRRPLLELATDAPLAASAEYRMMVDSRMKTSGGKGLYNGDIYLMRGVSVDT